MKDFEFSTALVVNLYIGKNIYGGKVKVFSDSKFIAYKSRS